MTDVLAPNLAKRRSDIGAVYPHMVIEWIGDAAHQAEQSDHNPDSRGIVHAIDVMTGTDIANDGAAGKILAWALSWPADLEYIIHDSRIYERSRNFAPEPYDGSNPHTNHIHLSGRHGSVGADHETGTGYDTAAETMSPPSLTAYLRQHEPAAGATPPAVGSVPVVPEPPAATPPAARRELRLTTPPMQGADVSMVQAFIGLACGPVDGIYGPHTAGGVEAFQRSHHLAVDGIVGPLTWHALLQA